MPLALEQQFLIRWHSNKKYIYCDALSFCADKNENVSWAWHKVFSYNGLAMQKFAHMPWYLNLAEFHANVLCYTSVYRMHHDDSSCGSHLLPYSRSTKYASGCLVMVVVGEQLADCSDDTYYHKQSSVISKYLYS